MTSSSKLTPWESVVKDLTTIIDEEKQDVTRSYDRMLDEVVRYCAEGCDYTQISKSDVETTLEQNGSDMVSKEFTERFVSCLFKVFLGQDKETFGDFLNDFFVQQAEYKKLDLTTFIDTDKTRSRSSTVSSTVSVQGLFTSSPTSNSNSSSTSTGPGSTISSLMNTTSKSI